MHVDDIKPGDWLAISALRTPSEEEHRFNGLPFRVKAISLPFLAVQSESRTYAIDVRRCVFTLVSAAYARALSSMPAKPRKKRKKLEEPDERACPRCGDRLCQRFSSVLGVWCIYCRECGYDGGQTESGATL